MEKKLKELCVCFSDFRFHLTFAFHARVCRLSIQSCSSSFITCLLSSSFSLAGLSLRSRILPSYLSLLGTRANEFRWIPSGEVLTLLFLKAVPNANAFCLYLLRYAFTVLSSLFVYVVTYFSLRMANSNESNSQLTPADAPKFMYLSAIVSIVGLFFQIVFHFGTNEKRAVDSKSEESSACNRNIKNECISHLKTSRFYTVGLLYMSTRLIINLCQVYVPMYLTDSIDLNKVSFRKLSCFDRSFLIKMYLIFSLAINSLYTVYMLLERLFGHFSSQSPHKCIRLICKHQLSSLFWHTFFLISFRLKRTCFLGICLILFCCVLFWFHELVYDKTLNSIVAAAILGTGSTVVSVTSLSIITELIGEKTSSGMLDTSFFSLL